MLTFDKTITAFDLGSKNKRVTLENNILHQKFALLTPCNVARVMRLRNPASHAAKCGRIKYSIRIAITRFEWEEEGKMRMVAKTGLPILRKLDLSQSWMVIYLHVFGTFL